VRVRIRIQLPRSRKQIAQGEKRKEVEEVLEDVTQISQSPDWVTFYYFDGTRWAASKNYLVNFEVIP